jgi:hypothetical protein
MPSDYVAAHLRDNRGLEAERVARCPAWGEPDRLHPRHPPPDPLAAEHLRELAAALAGFEYEPRGGGGSA